MIRLDRTSIPDYHESIPLRAAVRVPGWLASASAVLAGLVVAGAADGLVAELAGPLLVVLGGGVLAALWQCRRYEVTVGTVRIDAGTGPFRVTLATGAVESAFRRRSGRWRRLFADEEVVLRVTGARRAEYPVATRDPRALEAALS